jgi:Transposase
VGQHRSASAARPGWEAEILAFHATSGYSNGPTEAINLLVKRVKHVGHGFRNLTNYRLRLLLLSASLRATLLLRGRPKSVASQASELHERKIGITTFDCPRDSTTAALLIG